MKKTKKTEPRQADPERMSYESYAALKKLIEREKARLEEHYQIACWFIPSEPYKHGQKSTIEKIHEVFSKHYHDLTIMEEELHTAAACTYKNHPNPKMRQFWGVKE